jgi:hypothetical protein
MACFSGNPLMVDYSGVCDSLFGCETTQDSYVAEKTVYKRITNQLVSLHCNEYIEYLNIEYESIKYIQNTGMRESDTNKH